MTRITLMGKPGKTESSLDRIQLRRGLALAALVIAAVLLPLVGLGTLLSTGQEAVEWVRGRGVWTLPVFVLLAGVAAGCALVPSHLSSLLAGYLYGFWLGLPAALGVILIGCAIGAALSRRVGGEVLHRVIERHRWGRVLAAELIDARDAKATLAVALARLPPQMPFALGNVLAAAFGVRWWPLLIGTLTGMFPRVVLVLWVGAGLAVWEPGMAVPGSLWLAVAAGMVGMGGLVLWSGWILKKKTNNRERPK